MQHRGVEEEEGEWVGADHPKLQMQTSFHRWSEIEDTKDASLCANNTVPRRSESPAIYAPEVRALTPSCFAPEVLTIMRDEKMEVQEEKILAPEEKIARPVSVEDKILSPVTNAEEEEEADRGPFGRGNSRPRTICGLTLRKFYALVGIAFVILIAVIVAVSISVTKRHSSTQAGRASQNGIPTLRSPSMAALSWKDQRGVDHYKVYYQDESNSILESAWNSTQTFPSWKHAIVADPTMNVQPGSPLGAAAGWPHANYSYTLVSLSSRKLGRIH